ncbi:PGF-CTERM-anchored ABC transporter substrate-binding protein [Haloparvum sp. AD34]
MRSIIALVTALLLVTSLVGGAAGHAAATQPDATYEKCEFPVTVTDATGEEITMEERPERVTTTNPSAAQTMWEIGGQAQVVGLTQYALYLDGAESRTDVSAEFGVSVEKVVGTQPDLVLAPNATQTSSVEAMRDAGLTVYHLREAKTVEDVAKKTTRIGKLTGNCEGAAEANAWMKANVDAVADVTADADQPDVLYPLGGGYVAAGDTFINAMFRIAGTNNVAAQNHTGYPQLSDEVILKLDPGYIVVNDRNATMLDKEPYASTTAGEENNSIYLETRWLNQPAPRSVVYTTHNMTAQVHSDLYSEDTYVAKSEVSVKAESEVEATEETATPTATAEPTETNDATETSEGSAPGFGVTAAFVAMLAAALVAARVDA